MRDAGAGAKPSGMAKKASSKADAATETASTGTLAVSPKPPYVVLARKYRPSAFPDLIGQEAMVRTLSNAFATGRIAQAYMLTGVRGVGKTTTARILARALNYSLPGQVSAPTTDMPVLGEHCQAIIESRHADVLEMDAASNTGVDNVREIIESARYRPILARTKVFIVDEVHMLSKGAFNALLKTLEEPPEHAKFIFATTEIRKVPVTVLSRCQRFDLRRVDVAVLAGHFRKIAAQEAIAVEDEALTLIARAAEGSVRDGLSVLDQAFATASGTVTAQLVRSMLGVADRGRIFDLLEALLGGQASAALEQFERLHKDSADPVQVLGDLAEAVHAVTRARVAGAGLAGDGFSAAEAERAAALAGKIGIGLLSRCWSMLLKGIEEAGKAPDAFMAAEMVLVRLAYVAELPSPDDLARRFGGGAGPVAGPASSTKSASGRAAVAATPAPLTQTSIEAAHPNSSTTAKRGAASSGPPPWTSGNGGHAAVARQQAPAAEPVDAQPAIVSPPALASVAAAVAQPAAPAFASFAELVGYVGSKRDVLLRTELEEKVRLVRFEPLRLELNPLPGADPGLPNTLAQKLAKWTGQRWMVAVSREPGEPPLIEAIRRREADAMAHMRGLPVVKDLLRLFPGTELVSVRPIQAELAVAVEPDLPPEPPMPDPDDYATSDPDWADDP